MIEHVSKALKKDPLNLRRLNLYSKGDVTPTGEPLPYFNVDTLINQLVVTSDYENRLKAVNLFNAQNRWKKRGLSMTPVKWGVGWMGGYYNCSIAVYASDGSIAVSHGGVEMGQGICFNSSCCFFLVHKCNLFDKSKRNSHQGLPSCGLQVECADGEHINKTD
jgi:xanthine dehydrogenase/oxidase